MFSRKTSLLSIMLIAISCEHNKADRTQLSLPKSTLLDDKVVSKNKSDTIWNKQLSTKSEGVITVDTLAFKTNPGFEADRLIHRNDTLYVIATSASILYPFGHVQHALDIKKNYPFFTLTKGKSLANGQAYPYTLLKHKNSAVKIYDDEEDGATVVSGHIVDKDIILRNTIHVGQSLGDILSTLFKSISDKRIGGVHVLRMDYVVDRIIYYYTFEDNKLKEINIDSYAIIDKSLQ